MGVNPDWQEDFVQAMREMKVSAETLQKEPFFFVKCSDRVWVNLLSLGTQVLPDELIQLQSFYREQSIQLFHLWEDIWLSKKKQVSSRITSFLGLNQSIPGRKTAAKSLKSEQASYFLDQYHLQGYVKAKFNYGLFLGDEIVAVASFSRLRLMQNKGESYRSAELVRFASKSGVTVVGGLSKLIKYFLKNVDINDLMTYADRDWSFGVGYEQLGFELTDITLPATIFVDLSTLTRYFPHRIPHEILAEFTEQSGFSLADFLEAKGYAKLFNTGNLKYHLFLK